MEIIKCDLCGSKNYNTVYERGKYNHLIDNVICKKCGLVYINPRMNEKEYQQFYSKEYRELHSGFSNKPIKEFIKSQEKDANRRIKNIIRLNFKGKSNSKNKILEIGCASGILLHKLKEKGYNV